MPALPLDPLLEHSARVAKASRERLTKDFDPDQPRDPDGRWTKVFHVAPRSARGSILSSGLRPSPYGQLDEVHGWSTEQAAKDYARRFPADLYEVDVSGMHVEVPKYPFDSKSGTHLRVHQVIPPERLKLVSTKDSGSMKDPKQWDSVQEVDPQPRDPATGKSRDEWIDDKVEEMLRQSVIKMSEKQARALATKQFNRRLEEAKPEDDLRARERQASRVDAKHKRDIMNERLGRGVYRRKK
jgi:hypothetical protein